MNMYSRIFSNSSVLCSGTPKRMFPSKTENRFVVRNLCFLYAFTWYKCEKLKRVSYIGRDCSKMWNDMVFSEEPEIWFSEFKCTRRRRLKEYKDGSLWVLFCTSYKLTIQRFKSLKSSDNDSTPWVSELGETGPLSPLNSLRWYW